MKNLLKEKAINLRHKGFSYSEILQIIPVAKSTLSLWLKSVELSKEQSQRLTEKKLLAIKKGGQSRKILRLALTKSIKMQAFLEIKQKLKKINIRDLWLMGIMLYWAEGAKQKTNDVSQGVCFSNSDQFMIEIFLKWLKTCLFIKDENISFDIYIHENHERKKRDIQKYWSNATGFPIGEFGKIYYKTHKLKINRSNIGNNYHGLLRVRIRKSTDLNRKISGWIEGICMQCRVV
jgi:hypothetical protein